MINEVLRCCMSLIIMTRLLLQCRRCISHVGDLYTSAWLVVTRQLRLILGEFPECGGRQEESDRSAPPNPVFSHNGTEVSLITVHAHLQMSLGSDRLESWLRIITCSGLVVCDQSMALRYPEGSVNKVPMQWMRILWSALCWVQWPDHCYLLNLCSGASDGVVWQDLQQRSQSRFKQKTLRMRSVVTIYLT